MYLNKVQRQIILIKPECTRDNDPSATTSYFGASRHVTQIIVAKECVKRSFLRIADNLKKASQFDSK